MNTNNEQMALARKRVTEFLAQRREARGLHPDIIHGYNHADLLISDLDMLLAASAAAQGEPVAWYLPSKDGDDSIFRDASTVKVCTGNKWEGFVPLYLAPPPTTSRGEEVVKQEMSAAAPQPQEVPRG